MQCIVVKHNEGLRGISTNDHDVYLRLKNKINNMREGDALRLNFATPRNVQHHRKFFALLKLISDNSETYDTVAKALLAVKLICAHAEPFIDPTTGEVVTVPKSIAFDAMTQEEFNAFYENALDGIVQYVVPHLSRDDAEQIIKLIVNEWGAI